MKSAIQCLAANLPALKANAKADPSQQFHVEEFEAAIAVLEKADKPKPQAGEPKPSTGGKPQD